MNLATIGPFPKLAIVLVTLILGGWSFTAIRREGRTPFARSGWVTRSDPDSLLRDAKRRLRTIRFRSQVFEAFGPPDCSTYGSATDIVEDAGDYVGPDRKIKPTDELYGYWVDSHTDLLFCTWDRYWYIVVDQDGNVVGSFVSNGPN